jgi:glutamine synthetase type III
MTMMRKAVGAVNNTLMHLNKHPNGDYENLLDALKSRNSKKFIPMLVPYVEDVIDEIEASDSSGIFTDSDIMDVADEVADRHMRAIGLLDEAKDCGCSDTKEEQEFMFAIKRKNKLKESLMAKAMSNLREASKKTP